MWDLVEVLAALLAPVMAHTADEAYRALHGDQACVHMRTHPELPDVTLDPAWPTVLDARSAALKALEDAKANGIQNALDAEVVLPDDDGTLARFSADFADMLGVSRVKFDAAATTPTVVDLREEPACERSWKRDGTVKQRSDGGWLSDRDAEAVGVA
jgi:isoleucyl-tRNA synthetase